MKKYQVYLLGLVAIIAVSLIAACNVMPQTDIGGSDALNRAATLTTLQAESQTWTTSSGDSVSASSSTLRLQADAVGDTFQFTGSVPAGTYSVTLNYLARNLYGTYSVKINGTQVGSTVDAYSSNTSDTATSKVLGNVTLSAATSTFLFTVTAKNSSATDYDFKLDNIVMTPASGGATATPTTAPTKTPTATPVGATPTPTPVKTATPVPTATPAPTATPVSGGTTVSTVSALISAVNGASAGTVITIASGTYNFNSTTPLKLAASGTSSNRITLKGASFSSRPVLNFGQSSSTDAGRGVDITGNYWTLQDIKVTQAGDNGIHIDGSNNNVLRVETYNNYDTGLQISGPSDGSKNPANNVITNCDSHDNYDTHSSSAPGADADGFAAKISIGSGNKFVGCVAHDNSDDGWDLFGKNATATVSFDHCVSYHNGYHNGSHENSSQNGNGFKLGSDSTTGASNSMVNCIAFNNYSKGFDPNHDQARNNLDHCTAANNGAGDGKANFAFKDSDAVGVGANLTNCVSVGKWEQDGGTDSGNVKTATLSNFTSTSPSVMSRDSSGNLLFNGFLIYTPSSAGAHQ